MWDGEQMRTPALVLARVLSARGRCNYRGRRVLTEGTAAAPPIGGDRTHPTFASPLPHSPDVRDLGLSYSRELVSRGA